MVSRFTALKLARVAKGLRLLDVANRLKLTEHAVGRMKRLGVWSQTASHRRPPLCGGATGCPPVVTCRASSLSEARLSALGHQVFQGSGRLVRQER